MRPDRRRATRSIVHAVGALAMLIMLAWIIHKVPAADVRIIGLGLVAILFVREMMHGAENVTARVKFKIGLDGASGEVGGDNSA